MSPTSLAAPVRLRFGASTNPEQEDRSIHALGPLFDEAVLLEIADPWQRSELAQDLLDQSKVLAGMAQRIRDSAIRVLVQEQRATCSRVALHLGVSISRISQLVRPGGRKRAMGAAEGAR